MRINQVLTPEMVLGKRGHEMTLELYKRWLGQIHGIHHGIDAEQSLHQIDSVTRYHFAAAWKYTKERARTYYVGKDFLESLYQVRSDVPLDLLPERFFAYIAFPQKTIFDKDGDEVRGGFVFVGPTAETPLRADLPYKRGMWLSWDYQPPATRPEYLRQYGSMLRGFDEDAKSFREQAKSTPLEHGHEVDPAIQMLFANLVLYITKADPELLPLKTLDHMTTRERKEAHGRLGVTNGCEIPLTLVSWNYQKPRTYHVDETTVRGFFRWQRHGPEFSQLKLIWIDEHTRKYKNQPKES